MIQTDARDRRHQIFIAALFLGLGVYCALQSTAFIEADDVTHYLYSRWLFRYPRKAVDIWGRPLVTLAYTLPAQLGPYVARLFSVVVGGFVAWVAVRLARAAGATRTALVVACTLGLPYVFTQTYGILTELLFAAILGAGFLAYRTGRPRAAALAWSLLPLARPEGFFLGVLFGVVFLAARSAHPAPRFSRPRFANALLLGAGTAGWWLCGLPVYLSPTWLIEEWPKNWAVESVYGHGHPFLFTAFLVRVVTPALFPLFVFGWRAAWRAGRRLEGVVIAFIVVLHTILWTFGLFGSAGYPRYLVTLAPLLGMFSGLGAEQAVRATLARRPTWTAASWRRTEWIVAAALALGMFLWPQVGPIRGDVDIQFLRAVTPWCREIHAAAPATRFVADHPFFNMNADLDPFRNAYQFKPKLLDYAEVGDVAIWESKFAARYGGVKKSELERWGFEPLPREQAVAPGVHSWEAPRPSGGDPELLDFQWDVFVKRR